MSTDQLGRAGVVPIGDRLFTVEELPGEAEANLLARSGSGPGRRSGRSPSTRPPCR
jgi:hypothetical protein